MSQQYKAAIEAWSMFKNDCPFADWAAFINGWNAAIAYRDAQAKAVNQQMLEALEAIVGDGVQRVSHQLQEQAKAALAAVKEADV